MSNQLNLAALNSCDLKTYLSAGVTGKHIPPRDIIPMGIDSLRNAPKIKVFFCQAKMYLGVNSENVCFRCYTGSGRHSDAAHEIRLICAPSYYTNQLFPDPPQLPVMLSVDWHRSKRCIFIWKSMLVLFRWSCKVNVTVSS